MQEKVIGNFPFGEPLKPVTQIDRTPKEVFVLGVYASAVHAKWYSKEKKQICKSLAVASEPYIFWTGDYNEAENIISEIKIHPDAGYLKLAEAKYNGHSGRVLDEKILAPLGILRKDAWLCDLIPHSLQNNKQNKAIESHYKPLMEKYNLPKSDIPIAKKSLVITDDRRKEILQELKASQATKIILLGQDPIRLFLCRVSDCRKKTLDKFGDTIKTYGLKHDVHIDGKKYEVTCLTHPRNIDAMGTYIQKCHNLHKEWLNAKKY